MKDDIILVIDTTSESLFVALIINGEPQSRLIKDCRSAHSVKLLPEIDELLTANGLTIKDVKVCALPVGPGSFTGIRIGVATAKAFQYALNIKILTVNSLEVAAYNYRADECLSLIDAGHKNAYIGEYHNGAEDLLFAKEEEILKRSASVKHFVSPYQNSFGAEVIDDYYENLIKLVKERNETKQYTEDFSPLYLKLSQAEEEENAVS